MGEKHKTGKDETEIEKGENHETEIEKGEKHKTGKEDSEKGEKHTTEKKHKTGKEDGEKDETEIEKDKKHKNGKDETEIEKDEKHETGKEDGEKDETGIEKGEKHKNGKDETEIEKGEKHKTGKDETEIEKGEKHETGKEDGEKDETGKGDVEKDETEIEKGGKHKAGKGEHGKSKTQTCVRKNGGKHKDIEGKTLIHNVNAEQRECEPHEEIETIVQETNETLLELKKIVKAPKPPEIRKKKDFKPNALQAKRAEIADLLVKLQTRDQKRNIEDVISKSAGIFDKLSPQDQRKAIHKVLSYFDKVRDQAKSHQISATTDSSQVYSVSVNSRFDAPQKQTKVLKQALFNIHYSRIPSSTDTVNSNGAPWKPPLKTEDLVLEKRDNNEHYETKSSDLAGKATDSYWIPDERHFTLNLFDTKPNDNDKVVTIIIEDDPLDTIDDIAAPRSRGEIMKFGTSDTDTVKNLFGKNSKVNIASSGKITHVSKKRKAREKKSFLTTIQTDDYDNAPLIADDDHDDVIRTANDGFDITILASDDEYTSENVLK
ncbi:hypothetical protein CDAR_443501 [Caerostris darwini]|uniref:Uncharacterized protein n=1 Tax=Caerostris darwini TaxID=1538125 RepID=A0AAV4R4X0_9ARAC|nr:hypothetical protein CDAR_443501 [Caerostris darwini]